MLKSYRHERSGAEMLTNPTKRRRRWAAVGLAAALLATTFGPGALPRAEAALDQIAGECNFVGLTLHRKSDGNYKITTSNTGICIISDFDLFGLPWDAAQVGQIFITASHVPAGNVTCSSSGAATSVDTPVTMSFADSGGNIIRSFPTVGFLLFDPMSSGAVSLVLDDLPTLVGAGELVRAAGANCNVSPPASGSVPAVTWSLGELAIEDPKI